MPDPPLVLAFGEDDYRVCLSAGVVRVGESLPCPVDADGRFTSPVDEHLGVLVKEADSALCTRSVTAIVTVTVSVIMTDYDCYCD